MCGLVGLHLKNPDLQPRLGGLLTEMLEAMTTGGPDSAGIAVYADRDPAGRDADEHELRYSLRSDETVDWGLLAQRIARPRRRARAGDREPVTFPPGAAGNVDKRAMYRRARSQGRVRVDVQQDCGGG